jgi:proteasome assembly chaperone (PAC2) family protein
MQRSTLVRLKENLELKKPILVVGLPGVGLVGKLVAEHLVDELRAEKNYGGLFSTFSTSGFGQ